MPTIDDLYAIRLKKLKAIQEKGIDPYPASVRRDQTIKEASSKEHETVSVAGRIVGRRGHGKIYFFDLKDESGSIQVVCKADVLKKEDFQLLDLLDIGDFVSVNGETGKTEAGELSVFAKTCTLISKSLRPLPDQWYGFKDVEERYRKRYLDILMNPKAKQVLDARFIAEKAIRTFLWGQGYTEVETPVLQPLYGGTNARPFTTHMNALDTDFYLRVAPELYLKRLIIGGYERVFEIARNFRNEGIDLTHQPEFTMIEFYESYADYQRIMDLTEDLVKYTAQAVNKNYILTVQDKTVDISGKWKRITIDEAMKKYAGIDWEETTEKEIDKLLDELQIEVRGEVNRAKKLFSLFEHIVTPKLIEPTWVIDYPREVSPLSRVHRTKKDRVERFEGYVGGKEICDGWSEIVSSIEQRERFEMEQRNMRAGDTEAQPLDEEFIESLEYGCPPLGGIGIGIDRLIMLLTNTWAIREVIAFPTLRPLNNEAGKHSEREQKQESHDLGISYQKAREMLDTYIKDPITKLHMRESEVIMRALAKKLGGDEEQWGIIGLLHDIDWERTKTNTKEHCVRCVEILRENGATDFLIDMVQSHGYEQFHDGVYTGPKELEGKTRKSKLEFALTAAETLTGLIIASALIQPDKKLASVKPESLMKKYKNKAFAANCQRERIAECEKMGIPLEEFLEIGLRALQDIHEELGL